MMTGNLTENHGENPWVDSWKKGVLVWWEWSSLIGNPPRNKRGCEITHKWRFIAGKIIPGEFSIATFDYWREAYSFTIFLFLDHICEIVYEPAEKIKRWSFCWVLKGGTWLRCSRCNQGNPSSKKECEPDEHGDIADVFTGGLQRKCFRWCSMKFAT